MAIDVKMNLRSDNIYDLGIDTATGDLEIDNSFNTAILYSFYGERRASSTDILVSQNRRGWIGNEFSDYENGSKIWLYFQSKLTRNNINRAASEAYNGWKWLIEDGLLKDINISPEFADNGAGLNASFIRFDSIVDKRFFVIWDNTGI